MMKDFYTQEDLNAIGFKSIGSNVLISRKASIFSPDNISIGNNVRIDDFCILSGGSGIILHNHIHIGAYTVLQGGAGIEIEDFGGTSLHCSVFSESDDFSGSSMLSPVVPLKYKPTYKRGPVLFKKHAGLGIHCTALPGVTLNEGSIVVGHSMITHDTEPWFLYFGVPARKLHARTKDILELEKEFLMVYNNSNEINSDLVK